MFKFNKKVKGLALSSSKGFTLLELLVVIGIIGLLASIVVVNLTGARKRARDTKRIGDLRGIQTALEDYYGRYSKYPAGYIDALKTDGQLPITPVDPLQVSGTACTANALNCYYYAYYPSANPYSYHIGANFEDGSSALLNQDRGCVSNTSAGTNCPYAALYTNGFNGANTQACDGATANRYCYDIAQ